MDKIENSAFDKCTGLTSVHILNDWTVFNEASAFDGCTKLTKENIKRGK
jgi:hypothetical protein